MQTEAADTFRDHYTKHHLAQVECKKLFGHYEAYATPQNLGCVASCHIPNNPRLFLLFQILQPPQFTHFSISLSLLWALCKQWNTALEQKLKRSSSYWLTHAHIHKHYTTTVCSILFIYSTRYQVYNYCQLLCVTYIDRLISGCSASKCIHSRCTGLNFITTAQNCQLLHNCTL